MYKVHTHSPIVSVTYGVAGQIQVDLSYTISFPDAADQFPTCSFVGSVYGGPVVMIQAEYQQFVKNPERFGNFAKDPIAWAESFATA